MRITKEKAYRSTFVAEYTDLSDFALALENRKWSTSGFSETWAGGTPEQVAKYCREGSEKWATRAETLVSGISNVSVANLGMDLDYNLVHGVLDYGAMEAGNPMCMYGTTITETDRAPIGVYIDNWITCTVPNEVIERRGVAILALVLALSVYRPVLCKYVAASGASFDHSNDNIQLIPIPTHPMDLGRAAFALCDPMFTRAGVYEMTQTIHNIKGADAGPMMGSGAGRFWQRNELGRWAADRDGAEEVVFLHMMDDGSDPRFTTDKAASAWVQETVHKYIHVNEPT